MLCCIHEVIVARRLVSIHKDNAFNTPGIGHKLLSLVTKKFHPSAENIVFVFNNYPHLQQHYEELPQKVQGILSPFIVKKIS